MLRLLPSAIDDALDTFHEPNAVLFQFLGSASVTFFSFCLSLLPLLVLYFLVFLVFSFLPFLFRFFAFFSLIFHPLSHFLCFRFPIDLRPSRVCVVIDTTCNIYVEAFFLGWQAV